MNQIGIAVLGAGRWGVHLVRNFLEHPQARVVAVVDSSLERLAAVRERFGLDDNVVLATDWATVTQHPLLDAVVIATPAATHYRLIAAALTQGYHVLAEKPLALNPAECLELCQLAKKLSRQLVVDHTYLFHSAVEQGQAVVKAGLLGSLRYGYATRTHLGPVRQDVDALWDLAIHDIAIFNNWLGQTPKQVQATGTVWLQGGQRRDDSATRPHQNQDLADLVWATLTYPDGFQAFIHLCWINTDKQRRIGLVGSQGSLVFDELSLEAPLTLLHGQMRQTGDGFTPVNQNRQVLEVELGEPLQRVCEHFLTCVRQNTFSPVSSGWVGTQLVEVLSSLTASLQQGGQPQTIEYHLPSPQPYN